MKLRSLSIGDEMTLEAHVCRERQGLVARAADKLFFLQ
jgi:hypothetical protein